jgi:glucosamine-6-phosphate deaminase
MTGPRIVRHSDRDALGRASGDEAAAALRAALSARGRANLILATGASQFGTLARLVAAPGIEWPRVTLFHLDEYVGLSAEHPASFRRYLRERFVSRLPTRPAAFHEIDGQAPDPAAECRRLGELILANPVDVALVGIGENAHLAFNDPPADFATEAPYIPVTLDEACRRQQFGEGWFPSLADVPTRAVSMSIRQILRSALIVCSVPERRKAPAVRDSLLGPVTPDVPASILRTHPNTTVHLDAESASLLGG